MLTGLKEILFRIDILIYLLLMIILGADWGYLETFLFVYLKEIGAPTYMLGKIIKYFSIIIL